MQSTLTRILREEPRPASSFGYGIPRGLDSIVARALRKARDSRYDSAAHMAADLECLIDGKPLLHATQLSPLETVALMGGSGGKGPAPVRVPVVDAAASDGSVSETKESKSSMRLAGAIGIGVAVGITVVLLAQQRTKADAPAAAVPIATVAPTLPPAQTSPPTPATAPATAPLVEASPTPALALSVQTSGPPAKVAFSLRYPFASASLRIKVDDQVVVAISLNGMPIKSGAEITGYDGRFGTDLAIPPGDHEVRVELRTGSIELSEAARVRLAAQSTRRLSAVVVDNRLTLSFDP